MKLSINAQCISLAVLVAAAPYAVSQESAAEPVAKPEIDIEARKASVVNLEEHIKDREERLAEVAQSIVDLDERVEKGIDKIVTRLKATSEVCADIYEADRIAATNRILAAPTPGLPPDSSSIFSRQDCIPSVRP